jgi:hypothetical protein
LHGEFGRWTHCSCPEPPYPLQNLVLSLIPLVSLEFLISPFLLVLSPYLKITFLKILPFTKKVSGRGMAPF